MAQRTAPDVMALEHACLTAVPAQRIAFDGSFVVRSFLGGTGRANSASALWRQDDADLAERIQRIESRYVSHGLPVRFRSTPLDPPGLAEALSTRGYICKDETIIFLAPISGVARPDEAVRVLAAPDDDWMAVTATAEHQVPARRAEKQQAADMMLVPAAWLMLYEGGKPTACISIVADGNLAGFFDLAVVPEARRQGLAARITAQQQIGRGGKGLVGYGRKWLRLIKRPVRRNEASVCLRLIATSISCGLRISWQG